ncbi:MAG: hypothetical protein KDD45_05480 [Bdellovibrionales bacterium]|nr:hypothetical protein [Bdellovibrionales bacterium]
MRTPKRLTQSIKKDYVKASDYLNYAHRWSCEECTHFNIEDNKCTLAYNSVHHVKKQQIKDFELGGRIAFCRFHEID